MTGKKRPDHIPKRDWDDVNSPPLSDGMLNEMAPASDVVPDVVEDFRRGRGPQKALLKSRITLRLDADIVTHFRQTGQGWQTRINAALRKIIDQKSA